MSNESYSPKSSSSEEHIYIDMLHTSEIGIEHIVEEKHLNKYTDEHFINKLNEDLEKIRIDQNIHNESNSPIIMSETSDNGDSDGDYHIYDNNNYGNYSNENQFNNTNQFNSCNSNYMSNRVVNEKPYSFTDLESCNRFDKKLDKTLSQPRKLTFREVQKSINKYYETDDKYSNELDILTTYLKGQKNLYMKSRTITQTKINIFIIPSLIGTCIITIFAPIIQDYKWSGAFISGLNAFVALLVSFVHYLKLESSAEMYSYLTSHYDRLENSIEFTSNKLVFYENHKEKSDLVLSKMKEVEKKINEIKETTSIFIPEEVKKMFPIICNVNIFSFIKRIEVYKKKLLVKFKDIKNEILYIQWKWGSEIENKEKSRLDFLVRIKEKIKDEILHYSNAYGCIDELFTREIKRADNISLFTIWCFKKKCLEFSENPVLKEYFSTIFVEE